MSMNLPIKLDTNRLWTLEEFHQTPDNLPFRVDLIEGRLRIMAPGERGHSRIGRRLAAAIEQHMPAGWQVDTDVGTVLSDDPQRPTEVIPDVVVYSADCPLFTSPVTPLRPDDIALIVEIVSPNSRRKDRFDYPRLYEAAGIRHFWRVETPKTNPDLQVFTYRLRGRTYRLEGDYTEILKVEQPFSMTIDVPALAS